MSTVLHNERILANRSVPDEITPGDDTIDSRDVIARIEYLEAERDDWYAHGMIDDPAHEDEWNASDEGIELAALKALAEQNISEWDDGAYLISESHFEDYAQELHEEINGDSKDGWPYNCIDWKEAAAQLQQDYTSVEFGDVTYYVRS